MIDTVENERVLLEHILDGLDLRRDPVLKQQGYAEHEYLLYSNGSCYRQVPQALVDKLLEARVLVHTPHGFDAITRQEKVTNPIPVDTPLLVWCFVRHNSVLTRGSEIDLDPDQSWLLGYQKAFNAVYWNKGPKVLRLCIEGLAYRDGPPMISSAIYGYKAHCIWSADATDVLRRFAHMSVEGIAKEYPTLIDIIRHIQEPNTQQAFHDMNRARHQLERIRHALLPYAPDAAARSLWDVHELNGLSDEHQALINQLEAMLLELGDGS